MCARRGKKEGAVREGAKENSTLPYLFDGLGKIAASLHSASLFSRQSQFVL